MLWPLSLTSCITLVKGFPWIKSFEVKPLDSSRLVWELPEVADQLHTLVKSAKKWAPKKKSSWNWYFLFFFLFKLGTFRTQEPLCLDAVILHLSTTWVAFCLLENFSMCWQSPCVKLSSFFFLLQRKHLSQDCINFEHILSTICSFQLLLYVLLNCSSSEKEFQNNCLFLQLLPADNCAHNIHSKGQPVATAWLKFPLCFCFAVAATHLIIEEIAGGYVKWNPEMPHFYCDLCLPFQWTLEVTSLWSKLYAKASLVWLWIAAWTLQVNFPTS